MPDFDSSAYGPVFASLLEVERCRSLAAGRPDWRARPVLEKISVPTAFAHTKVVDSDMAKCCLAGVWLLYDFLDDSHHISQEIETPAGSYWHGVMHRREGDFANAKYWFRRVGPHPVFRQLNDAPSALAEDDPSRTLATRLAPQGQFDPFAMVDACQAAMRSAGPSASYLRRVQQAEWETLFTHCYAAAVGDLPS